MKTFSLGEAGGFDFMGFFMVLGFLCRSTHVVSSAYDRIGRAGGVLFFPGRVFVLNTSSLYFIVVLGWHWAV